MQVKQNPRANLKEYIYSEIFQQIIQGEYRETRILNEKMLIDKFQVSKSPVREALIALCNEGVLRSIPRYGYEIVRISARDVAMIRDYRVVLECGCLDQYWDMITEENIKELEEYQQIYNQSVECNALEHWKRNSTFHLMLASFYNNDFILQNLKSSLLVLSRAYAQFHWDNNHKTVFLSKASTHDKMLEHMKLGNKEKAVAYLRSDICVFDNDQYI